MWVAVLFGIPEEAFSVSAVPLNGEANTVFHADGFKDELLACCRGAKGDWVQKDEAMGIFQSRRPVNEGPERILIEDWDRAAPQPM